MRYLVFAGDSFYASGGALDFKGAAATLPDAVAIARGASKPQWEIDEPTDPDPLDWWHVFDLETKTIVAGKGGSYCGGLPDGVEETR